MFTNAHPRWQEYKEFFAHAKELYHMILKEQLGMYLTAEHWIKTKFDVTWITWTWPEPYPDPVLWDSPEEAPLLGNCPACKRLHILWEATVVGGIMLCPSV